MGSVQTKVGGFRWARLLVGNEDDGFGLWIMKVLGLEVGVGEGVEAVGLSGFVVEVVLVVGLPIWCWWAMGCESRF